MARAGERSLSYKFISKFWGLYPEMFFNDFQIVLDSFSLMNFGKKSEKNITNHLTTNASKLSLNISNTITPQAPLAINSSVKRNEFGSTIYDKPIRIATVGLNKGLPFIPKQPSFSYYFKSSFCILNKKIKKAILFYI